MPLHALYITEPSDPTPSWTRRLGDLRTRALKLGLRRPGAASPLGDVLEEALTTAGAVLKDFAGAQVECGHLRARVDAEFLAWQDLFDVMPSACVMTDADGVIRRANAAAGGLLHLSAKHLQDRQLLLFTEDRDAFGRLLGRLGDGRGACRASLTLRPRDRRPVETDVIIAARSGSQKLWVWFFVPCAGSSAVAAVDAFGHRPEPLAAEHPCR